MEVKTLTTEEQIQVLKEVRKRLLNRIFDLGLCDMFRSKLFEIYGITTSFHEIPNYIPLFRMDYAIKHAKATYGLFWWPQSNKTDRLAFLDWMISELEKQLNN